MFPSVFFGGEFLFAFLTLVTCFACMFSLVSSMFFLRDADLSTRVALIELKLLNPRHLTTSGHPFFRLLNGLRQMRSAVVSSVVFLAIWNGMSRS